MKKAVLSTALLLVAAPVLAGGAGAMKTPSGWFDMENCAFCKSMVEDPDLLDHVTWENHSIADGMMTITTVEPEYAEALAKANAAMQELGMKMQTGKVNPMEVKMCGHCAAFGQLMMAGVKMESVKGEAAEVTLATSDDPALVDKLHGIVKRNKDEMAIMMAAAHDSHAH